MELERLGQGLIVVRAAADDQGEVMGLAEGVDGLDAGGAMRGLHLVQPIEKRQDLVGLDPRLADLAGDVVPLVELLHQPFRQGTPQFGPGRGGKTTGIGCVGSPGSVQQVAGQLQQQRRLPGARALRMSICSMASKTFTICIPGGSGRSP